MENQRIAAKIIVTEKTALTKLYKGNLQGFTDVFADDITFFDPYLKQRLDGRDKVVEYYENLIDTLSVVKFDMIDPVVKVAGRVAILSFNMHSWTENEDAPTEWNCTEVYMSHPGDKWLIVHSHWSFTSE